MADSGWTAHGHPREDMMSMRRMAALLFAGGLAAGAAEQGRHRSELPAADQRPGRARAVHGGGQPRRQRPDTARGRELPGLRQRRADPGTRLGRTTGAGVVRSAATTPALPSPDTR